MAKAKSRAVDPVDFVAHYGVVLASAKGPVPNLAEAVAGEPIRGSWWAHKRGNDIFNVLEYVNHSEDVLCFRLVEGKITYVHRRVWPALVCLARKLKKAQLTAIHQEHTETGAHRNVLIPFPKWVSAETKKAAARLSEDEARKQLGAWFAAAPPRPARRRTRPSRTAK